MTPSQRILASPTELVYCKVATRAKSAAKLLTIRSICILLILGILAASCFTPGSSLGTACPTSRLPAILQLLLHFAHERGVLFEKLPVFRARRPS